MVRISIALCTYNGERFLQEQLDSFAAQTRLPDEVVVCDDGSSDATVSIVQRWAASVPFIVKIVENERNLGFAANFQQALKLCSGTIVFPSDQDDVWYPEKIAQMTAVFEDDPDVAIVYCNARVVDEQRNVQIDNFAESVQPWRRYCISRYVTPLWNQNRMDAGCCSAIRRDILDKILPVPDGWYHDMWIYAFGPLFGKIEMLEQRLIEHRTHAASVTNQNRGWGKECMTHNFRGAVFMYDMYKPRMDQLAARLTQLPDATLPNPLLKRRYEKYLKQTAAHFEARKRVRGGGLAGLTSWLGELFLFRYFRYNQPWRALAFDLKEGLFS